MIFFMNMNIIITDYAQEQRPEKWQTNACCNHYDDEYDKHDK